MRFALVIAAAAAAFSMVACDGQADKAAEVQADTIENAGEAQADALESQAAGTSNEAAETTLNNQADAVEHATDAQADAVEQQAGAHD